MRKAGDVLKNGSRESVFLGDAITNAVNNPNPMLGPIASEHIDLDRGVKGLINDGDNRSIIYKGNNKIEGRFDGLGNPLPGQPAGSKDLRQMPETEFEEYNNIWEQNDIRRNGTGNMAKGNPWTGGVSNEVPFT